jgi:hypothetical protein
MSSYRRHRTCEVCRSYGERIHVDLYMSESKPRLINAFDGNTHYHCGLPKHFLENRQWRGDIT